VVGPVFNHFPALTLRLSRRETMKRLKLMFTTLAVLVALSGAFTPLQVVRADGPIQGTSDSQKKSTTSSQQQQAAAQALWYFILWLLGWLS